MLGGGWLTWLVGWLVVMLVLNDDFLFIQQKRMLNISFLNLIIYHTLYLFYSLRDVQAEDPITFYGAWPDLMAVKDKWQPLVVPVFQEMSTAPVFYTETDGGQWIALDQATLCVLHEDVKLEISQTIEHVYSLCHEKLVKIPQHVVQGLRTAGTLATVKTVTPNELSRLLKTCQSKLQAEEKTWILTYLCEQNDVALLEGLDLLPLHNGDFATFDPYGDAVYFCQESELQLFPSLESRFCSCHLSEDLRGHLLKISQTGKLLLQICREALLCSYAHLTKYMCVCGCENIAFAKPHTSFKVNRLSVIGMSFMLLIKFFRWEVTATESSVHKS